MMELRKWKLAFVEQHRLELKKEREKHAAHVAAVNAEMDGLKDLINTYQLSNQRKDEVCTDIETKGPFTPTTITIKVKISF